MSWNFPFDTQGSKDFQYNIYFDVTVGQLRGSVLHIAGLKAIVYQIIMFPLWTWRQLTLGLAVKYLHYWNTIPVEYRIAT